MPRVYQSVLSHCCPLLVICQLARIIQKQVFSISMDFHIPVNLVTLLHPPTPADLTERAVILPAK